MSDKLSDSGIIAILIAKKDKHDLLVDELTFSCRALGRNIEDIVITKMLMMSKVQLNTSEQVKIYYKTGPRNAPALNWLSAYCGVDLHDEGIVIKKLSDDFVTYGLNMKEVIYVK
jgi:predicted enzyme involved in methoxymalonyl-ACP biosynthesis